MPSHAMAGRVANTFIHKGQVLSYQLRGDGEQNLCRKNGITYLDPRMLTPTLTRIATTGRIYIDTVKRCCCRPGGANGGIRIDIEGAGAQAAHTWLSRLIKTGVRPLQLTAVLQLTGRLASAMAQAVRESFQL